MEYEVIRSKRKTIGLEIGPRGLIVRVPMTATKANIEQVIASHREWVEKNLQKMRQRQEELETVEPLSAEELAALAEKAKEIIPQRVRFYAEKIGVSYGRITIRHQRTKWGSCSSKGNLNFNCLLMLAPPPVLDSVIVHELCHRKEMNHSERFYAEVLRVFPEYRTWDRWLKQNGAALMKRMVG